MRLLNIETYNLEEYFEPNIPSYAILSHRWEEDEVLYSDIGTLACKSKKGWSKVKFTCDQARKDHLDYVWVDTCCIDKTSSAELSEAINSMFQWYQNSSICYAYLSDLTLPVDSTHLDAISSTLRASHSAWFGRGWTLQELVVPRRVVFYDKTWVSLGDRKELSHQISQMTHVEETLLSRDEDIMRILPELPVAQKMAWAADRETARIEDRAYSLLGLFGVNMPLLYGEGPRAFSRLQEEIIRTGTDLSILAWSPRYGERQSESQTLLAQSPDNFRRCQGIVRAFRSPYMSTEDTDFAMTNKGLQISHPPIVALTPKDGEAEKFALSLGCRHPNDTFGLLALKIHMPMSNARFGTARHPRKRTCYLGWPSDKPGCHEKVIRVGFFEPVLRDDWQAITIPKQCFARVSVDPPAVKVPHDYLWFLLPNAGDVIFWRVLDVWPQDVDIWDQQIVSCHLGPITDSSLKYAAITMGNEIQESFTVYLKYNNNNIEFSLSRCDFRSSPVVESLQYKAVQDILKLSPWCRIAAVRHDVQRCGHTIRQLKLKVNRFTPSTYYQLSHDLEGERFFSSGFEL